MWWLKRLWHDQRGSVVTTEAVLVGAMGVAGASVGLKMTVAAMNEEFQEIACAFRSFDQSYSIKGLSSSSAAAAGSSYRQPDVQTSLRLLRESVEQKSLGQNPDETQTVR